MATADLDLCYLSAREAIAAFKVKSLSPVELMTAIIARIEAVNPVINALTHTYFERALEQAKKAEAKYQKTDGRLGALEGVPLVIKDLHPIKGHITTLGSKAFADYRPDHSAPTVARLLRAGAILHAQSTTPEFGSKGCTSSPLWGITYNPWNQAFSAGGSSGGSAAAQSSGMTILADGTDGGGSIRTPAAANGIFGYKPPFGRNPLDAGVALEDFVSYGPITRSVADAALMQNVTSGRHADDICSLRSNLRLPDSFEGIKGWRIAFSMDLGYFEIDPVVQKNTLAALDIFRGLGCEVHEVEIDWDLSALDVFTTHWECMMAAGFADILPRWRYEFDPWVTAIIERGMRHDAARGYRLKQTRGEMYRRIEPILEHYDILLCPTTAIPAVAPDHDHEDPDFRINGKIISPAIQMYLTYPFNLLGQLPAASVPSGYCPDSGIPTGLQIVARSYDDLRVFRAAAAYEAANPWRGKRPDL